MKPRKELLWGGLILIVWLIISVPPFRWLLLVAGIALLALGLMPDELRRTVLNLKDRLLSKLK